MTRAVTWHTDELRRAVSSGMTVKQIHDLLETRGLFTFPQLDSGLFPAVNASGGDSFEAGYRNAWMRDSAIVAYDVWRSGQSGMAVKTARGLIRCLKKVGPFFDFVINADEAPADSSQRPPIRFTGQDSEPLLGWANAQNDALGYCLWLIGALVKDKKLVLTAADQAVITKVIRYFRAIKFWQDSDSGHWEEALKVSASSVGAAMAGIQAVRPFIRESSLCDTLLSRGQRMLDNTLPNESLGRHTKRRFDAALLFLIEPLGVIEGSVADSIVGDIEHELSGDFGVRRYLHDSYWAPDYRKHFNRKSRSSNFSGPKDLKKRDAYLARHGEAQWTLFDTMLAVHYARLFRHTRRKQDKEQAFYRLQRSLGQIIERPDAPDRWCLPEAYCLERGVWVPNDNIGLLWSHANLMYALQVFSDTFGSESVPS